METPPEIVPEKGTFLLLKLKRVEIQGFKSFYDRTEMKFNGSGIAAVVGPNGCGKSNLSDAISWVLGEQSAKSLRGARMEDVIFAGTRDKKALGMASVTMTLVPDESALAMSVLPQNPAIEIHATAEEPTEPEPAEHDREQEADRTPLSAPPPSGAARTAEKTGEVTITRRLYRSGESEYLINGKLARLRDIQDLFMGTGLGPESYAIIEQGRIGQILSNKPQDRRNVIEEAAGITKFRTRKRLAEAKLESAKQNLSRVFDILEEVNRQVNSLRRQAAKTKRYAELRTEAVAYLKGVLSARFKVLERQMAELVIELNLQSSELQTAQTAIGERETEQTGILEKSYGVEQALTAARKQLADLHVEAERARGKLEYQTRQIEGFEKRLASGEGEALTLERQEAERAAELEGQTAELAALDSELAASREELDARAADRQHAQIELSEQERSLEAARQSVLRLLGESSALKNRITQMETQAASAERERARAQSEEEQSLSDLGRIEKIKAEISSRLQSRQTELLSVTDQRRQVESELQNTRGALAETRQTLDRVRGEHSRLKARKDSLEDIIEHRSYTTETVKRLFTAVEKEKAGDFHPVGVLADFLEVTDPQLEKATEEFLHEELEYVIVRNWAEAESGVKLMRSGLDGRATFLVEEESGVPANAALPLPETSPAIAVRLTDALRMTNGLSGMPVQSMHRIAHSYVVTDRPLAQQLAGEFPHCWFLTRDGVNYHGRAVSGGKKSGAGPLALKRELRELAGAERAKRVELESAAENLASLEQALGKLGEHLEYLRGKQQAEEKDVLALDHESRKLAEEFTRVQSRLSHARLELDRLGRDRGRVEENLSRDRAALGQIEASRAAQEAALEGTREALFGLQAAVARATEEHSTLRAGLASIEERRRAAAAHKARLHTQVQDLANRRAHLLQESERMVNERAHLLRDNTELEHRLAELTQTITGWDSQAAGLAASEEQLRSRLTALEEDLKRWRAQAQNAQETKSQMQVALARAESDLKHLEETSLKELNTPLAELAGESETIPGELELAQLEAKYEDIRRKIEALGPVNPQALEEFEESQQRQDFLNAQRQDLLDSIRDTEKAIGEIDGESRKRFGEAFTAINANFREMFKLLFGGGMGEMRLTDEDNLAESGIDIVASPPGKRMQSVLLLSGGEKSLTAMALLMAVFQFTPSPFCVLDEVDAPLDEPNTERLTRLLREMANQTQFIVITHSKRTMEAAHSLYGVTMQEPGVSKLVSVKFDSTGEAMGNAKAAAAGSTVPEQEGVLV